MHPYIIAFNQQYKNKLYKAMGVEALLSMLQ